VRLILTDYHMHDMSGYDLLKESDGNLFRVKE
jgi:CheY-like chemotaxis protein